MNSIVKSKSEINFMVSPEIELLSVIQILNDELEKEYKDYYINNEYYVNEIKKYFSEFKNHPAITSYRNHQVYNAQMYNYVFDEDKLILDNEDVDDKYREYLDLLNDFVEKSDFKGFFNKMNEYYNNTLNYNVENIDNLNIGRDLSNYYQKPIKINVILKMIQSDWGEYLSNKEGTYNILCGITKMEEYPQFINIRQLSSLCFHECTHPFVNKYITTDYDLLAKTEQIFTDVDDDSVAKKEYYTYNDYLEDLIVRAITAYMHYKYGYSSKEDYEKELSYMSNIGFNCIKDIANIVETNDFYSSVNLIKEYLLKKVEIKTR